MKRCISDSVLNQGRPNIGPLPHGPAPDYLSSSFTGVQPCQEFGMQPPSGMRPLPEYEQQHAGNSMMTINRQPPAAPQPLMLQAPPQPAQPMQSQEATTNAPPKSNNWLTKQLNELTEKYRDAVCGVAQRYLDNMDEEEVYIMKKMFSEWKSERDKLDVNNMYKLPGWRAIYTRSLFLSRIQTVEFSINRVLFIKAPRKILLSAKQYVSLGCGPGPCIAAVLMVLRSELGVGHNIEFVGVDQFIGWKPYIDSLSMKDNKSIVSFKQMRVDESIVDELPPGEVVIMSYTDASIHTPAFWEGMRKRYQLILILDQNKSKLHSLLVSQKFRPVEYILKGRKRFYYQVSNIVSKEILESKRSKGPPLVQLPNEEPTDSTKPSNEAEQSPANESETKSEPSSDDSSDVVPLTQMLELKAVEQMLGGPVQKTKCGTQSGRYSGALEPQKKMTVERMNQLLKAKLIAMEESGIDMSTNDSVSETSVGSPSVSDAIPSEAGDDPGEDFNILDSEELMLLDSIKFRDDEGTVTFDSYQPVSNDKPPVDTVVKGQSIPVITSTSSNQTRQKFEFPKEFLEELFDTEKTTLPSDDQKSKNDKLDLREVLKRKRKFSDISAGPGASPSMSSQTIVPIKMECKVNVNRKRYVPPIPQSSSTIVSEPMSIPVLSSMNANTPLPYNNNHFKQPRRFSTGAVRCSQPASLPSPSLLGSGPPHLLPVNSVAHPQYAVANITPSYNSPVIVNPYAPYASHLPASVFSPNPYDQFVSAPPHVVRHSPPVSKLVGEKSNDLRDLINARRREKRM